MLQGTTLDYVQHEERGYCVNNPAVIAGTKDQVVDRAAKQLLTALQANGFELDGNILKRGNGWLQYDAVSSKWQYSNDAGVTWQDMGSGSGGVPAEIGNPVTIGTMQVRDNGGTLELSGDGSIWNEFYASGWDLNLQNNRLLPPLYAQEADPSGSLNNGACAVWKKTSTEEVWLLYKDQNSLLHRVYLPEHPPMVRFDPMVGRPEVWIDGEWKELYVPGYTELSDSYFVPPVIQADTQPTVSDPIMANSGSLGIWADTTTYKVYLIFNAGGAILKVELT